MILYNSDNFKCNFGVKTLIMITIHSYEKKNVIYINIKIYLNNSLFLGFNKVLYCIYYHRFFHSKFCVLN